MIGVRNMKQCKILFLLVFYLIIIANVYSQDWPQHPGPFRNSKGALIVPDGIMQTFTVK
jgi:hypothetical protein